MLNQYEDVDPGYDESYDESALTDAASWQQIITSILESVELIEQVYPPAVLIQMGSITVDDAVKYSKMKSSARALIAQSVAITLDQVEDLVCMYQHVQDTTGVTDSSRLQEALRRYEECLRNPDTNLTLQMTLDRYSRKMMPYALPPDPDPAALQKAIKAQQKLKEADAARKKKAIAELQQKMAELKKQLDALNGGGTGGGTDPGTNPSPVPAPPSDIAPPPPPPAGEVTSGNVLTVLSEYSAVDWATGVYYTRECSTCEWVPIDQPSTRR